MPDTRSDPYQVENALGGQNGAVDDVFRARNEAAWSERRNEKRDEEAINALPHVLFVCPGCLFRQIDGVISARRLRLAMNSPTDGGPFVRLG
jgi:hypothetical protein